MSDIADFGIGSFRATKAILNYGAIGGTSSSVNSAAANQAREVLSGALTANVLATALSVTGAGEIGYLSLYSKDATSRTLRIKITVDGNTTAVVDATSGAVAAANAGILIVGYLASSAAPYVGIPIPLRWNASLLIEIASSLTETDKIAIAYNMSKV